MNQYLQADIDKGKDVLDEARQYTDLDDETRSMVRALERCLQAMQAEPTVEWEPENHSWLLTYEGDWTSVSWRWWERLLGDEKLENVKGCE